MVPTSVAAVAAAERASSASPPFFALSPPAKWIPLPLRQPPRPPMTGPLPSPLVWRLLSMLRILLKGGGGGALARWRGDDNVRVLALARCCWRRGEDATINIRWEVGGGRVTMGGFKVVAVRGGSRCHRLAVHCVSADHCDRDAGRCHSAVRWSPWCEPITPLFSEVVRYRKPKHLPVDRASYMMGRTDKSYYEKAK